MEEDKRLIERYIAGDDMAVEKLVMRYQKQIYVFIFRMTRDREEAKDLTQQTFLNAVRGIRDFRGESSFKTWLYQIASHAGLNHIRKGRREEVEVEESLASNQAGALSLIIEKQRQYDIKKGIEGLPGRQRLAVVLRACEGLSCEETAVVMGCSEGAVKANYHNGVKKLKEILRNKGHETVT